MQLFLEYAWLVPVLPFVGFVLISLTPLRHQGRASAWLATALMGAATLLALGIFGATASLPHAEQAEGFAFVEPIVTHAFRWAPAGDGAINLGYLIDPLAAIMLAMVAIAATAIHLFSIGYMADDARQARFFSFISLFSAAMLLMVIASNLL
ncbi:MAG TPA: NADH-quinone oxidoreductase subunit L, partial [Roseiflexaceae bacterium]|nr:NADH-quinone oxidoreductase subunit L [Roseiflexaceae bacterium]